MVKGVDQFLLLMQQKNLWFIQDRPLQTGAIQLWAPRFTDFFLFGIINRFCVIRLETTKHTYRENENPQQKYQTRTVDARIKPLNSPIAFAFSVFFNTVINGMRLIKLCYLYICVAPCRKLISNLMPVVKGFSCKSSLMRFIHDYVCFHC